MGVIIIGRGECLDTSAKIWLLSHKFHDTIIGTSLFQELHEFAHASSTSVAHLKVKAVAIHCDGSSLSKFRHGFPHSYSIVD